MKRCEWVNEKNEAYIAYHDYEWGKPIHDDRTLFEFIVLESAQAGLSWETILKKREGYRKAFFNFDYTKVAQMSKRDVEKLMNNPSIVRNRRKIEAVIANARCFLAIQKECGSFDAYLWSWTEGKTLRSAWKNVNEIPTSTPLSKTISHDLIARGFTFLGPVIWYSYMQAVGVVNDHTSDCFCSTET